MPGTNFTQGKPKRRLYSGETQRGTSKLLNLKIRVQIQRCCTLIFLLLHLVVLLGATTFYVDAENGDDANDGTAPSAPWQTILKVNSTVFAPGDSILFRRGVTWTDGPLIPANGGAPGGTIVIADQVLSQPILFELVDPNNHQCIYFGAYGSGPKPRFDCRGRQGLVLEHNYLIVEGLHLDNGGNNVLDFERVGGNYWNLIKEVDVTHTDGNAVRFSTGGGNCWLDGLYVYDYRTNGIYLEGSPLHPLRHILVENCRVDEPEFVFEEDAISCHRDALGNNIFGEVIIRNNTISRSGEDGIDITSGSLILVEGNKIDHCLSGGIYVDNPWVNRVEIRGNFLNSNSISQGVGDLTIGSPQTRAVNNLIVGTGHHSLVVQEAVGIEIWHNVVAPGDRTGNFIWLRDSVAQAEFKNNIFDFSGTEQTISGPLFNHTFDSNCYYGVSPDAEVYSGESLSEMQDLNSAFEPNGFWADPLFVNPQKGAAVHFQLSDGSPCLDRGVSLPVDLDYYRNERPQGSGLDIGVYERDANLACPPVSAVCDDGDPSTYDDVEDGHCNCAGTPCPETGTACDDGNPNTVDDVEDGFCSCAGVSICPPAGEICDDGDPATYDDAQDGDCNCVGAPCPPAGTICDDGDPDTSNDIEDGFCNCAGSRHSTPVSIEVQVTGSEDDAEETIRNGRVDLNSSDLELLYDQTDQQVVGIRFQNVNIARAATITAAYIQFTVDETAAGATSIQIYGEDSDLALPFSLEDYNLSSRTRTSAFVHWSPSDWEEVGASGVEHRTPDIGMILQEIVNRPDWSAGGAVVFLFEGEGVRTAESYDGSVADAPKLFVDFLTSCPPAGESCDDGNPATYDDQEDGHCHCAGTRAASEIVTVSVNHPDDDVEERAVGGRINAGSADLDLGFAGNVEQNIGIRFASVDVQPNARIIDAYIQWTVNEASTGSSNLTIHGEATDNARPFTVAAYNVSTRRKTDAAVHWVVPDWPDVGAAGEAQRTPDLSAIVQEIVSRPGWQSGNAIVFALGGTGTRIAQSYDGAPAGAPRLIIEYSLHECPEAGAPCDDGDATTYDDAEDGDCRCAGTPCPTAGTACDDGNPATVNDVEDGFCNCAGEMPACPEAGTPCDDGDATTYDDVEDGDCNCEGTPLSLKTLTIAVRSSDDDAEEWLSNGLMSLNSSDLELGFDGDRPLLVGIRFNDLNVEPGSTIVRAYLQFAAGGMNSSPSELTIYGQAIDHAPVFTSSPRNISNRIKTVNRVSWSPNTWSMAGEAGPDQQTPDLKTVVQEILDRPGWTAGNSIVFLIEGNGTRTAESFDGSDNGAPRLVLEYLSDGAGNIPPNTGPVSSHTNLHRGRPVENERSSGIKLFPNPVDQLLTVRTRIMPVTNGAVVDLHIYDPEGRIVLREIFVPGSGQWVDRRIDVSHFVPGMYFVRINTGKELLTERMIKITR